MSRIVTQIIRALFTLLFIVVEAQAEAPTTSTLYGDDPMHPWHRLNAALMP